MSGKNQQPQAKEVTFAREEWVKLLRETETAHARFEAESGQPDPDWPGWYASFILECGQLPQEIKSRLSKEALAEQLKQLDRQYRAAETEVPWPEFYAERLV